MCGYIFVAQFNYRLRNEANHTHLVNIHERIYRFFLGSEAGRWRRTFAPCRLVRKCRLGEGLCYNARLVQQNHTVPSSK